MTAIDIRGLVEDGHLDLDRLFNDSDWELDEEVDAYTACCYGPDGDEPGQVVIRVETAEAYGIRVYRWADSDDSGTVNTGSVTLDRDEAVVEGKEHAENADETPDADDLIRAIVETGYFGDADADDISAICREATEYPQGYLLLPAGDFCGHPIGRMWTTNGYLQCDRYVTLDATYPMIEYAADALLRAVRSESDE